MGSGGIALYTIDAITGTRSLALTGRTLSSPLSTTKSHTLSFWASNTGVTVSAGATLTKSGPTLNGFTYYEYEVAQGTASVSLSGTSNIDEVRLFPKTARMRTVTYDELIGKTSECDENNRIIYYEYDKLGRLLFVKDEKMNIVKMYEYNNVSAKKQQGCPGIYYSHYTAETFAKDDCGVDYVGSDVTYTIPADKYTSTISQADADAKAENELLELGQQYANTNGTCIPIYKNQAQSQVFVSQNCEVGYTGGNVTYSVPADRYTSLISVADANQKALAEIEANGQAYANTNAVCVIDNNADWEWDNTTSYCLSVDGNLPPHLFIKETDVNPNSSTFNQTRWSDVGPDGACPANTYYNAQRSQSFTRNNCGSGYEGSLVSYSVPPGRYSSTVSQAAADQLAQNEINAYGQNYANSNGTCTPVAPQIDFWGENYVPGESFRVQLTNEETSEYFDFFAVDYGSNWLGYVPAGTYTITISSGSGNGYFYSASCQYFGWGSTYTFYGVTLDSNNSGCNIVDFHY